MARAKIDLRSLLGSKSLGPADKAATHTTERRARRDIFLASNRYREAW